MAPINLLRKNLTHASTKLHNMLNDLNVDAYGKNLHPVFPVIFVVETKKDKQQINE